MKKALLLALACVLGFGQSLVAQEEVTFVPDETQGYLFNRFQDNWFITVEGGAGVLLSKHDSELSFKDRIAPAGSIYFGKWFSPVLGLRLGVNALTFKSVAENPAALGARPSSIGKYFDQKGIEVGPVGDVMLNLTNWWCGYKADRVYNATFSIARKYNDGNNHDWANADAKIFNFRAGLINSFRLSERVALSLDIRYSALAGIGEVALSNNSKASDIQAYLGVTYNFKQSTWKAPVVPVCPEPENCDALRARLAAADARISDLEKQLKDCLNRPVEKAVEKGPVATIYYPIGVSRLTREDRNILGAIANVMKDNPNQHYTLTGWADNYTGTEQINIRLRKARVAGVEKELKKNGVPASQITATTNNGSLCDLGEKFVALDRAVTIEETK